MKPILEYRLRLYVGTNKINFIIFIDLVIVSIVCINFPGLIP